MAPGTVVLGKRKRRAPAGKAADADAKAEEAAAMEEAQAIFRKHFEAQFAPLEGSDDDKAGKPAAKGRRKGPAGKGADGDRDDAAGVEDMRSETSDSGAEDDSDGDGDGDSDSDSDSQDEWDGLSAEDDGDDGDSEDGEGEGDDDSSEGDETGSGPETRETNSHQIEVVDYSKPTPSLSTLTPQTALMTKREMRAYLSSRPPESAVSPAAAAGSSGKARSKQQQQQQQGDGGEDPQNEDSRSLLKNDLELQRLISESHILSATNPFNAATSGATAPSKAFSEGRTRALTTDLRLQRLGSSGSIFNSQKKMPMNVRKGILGAKAAREEKRRREAKENGIILERERPDEAKGKGKGTGKKAGGRRQGRGSDLPVDMPGMGRMKGGELRLSKRDVRAVEMEGKRMGDQRGKGKHRRRR
ncbi:hypothetical protein KVR01_008775 [Diaporthe batatas]|uniref:uncharacterized protein n=1 Tax=Diaporthe batatas TaxID=748121 RepID=UPI001D04087B|nr:uncharacterized protein KVR01_008775 [Diaporthe batatas]KAG8161788.1 hypothetical protein KVR01_008775 [Diaporthe batatas]